MQKRLLALVATVAVVLSMFAGIAFAEVPTHVLTLGEPVVTDGTSSDLKAVFEAYAKDPNGQFVTLQTTDFVVQNSAEDPVTAAVAIAAGGYVATITLDDVAAGDYTVVYKDTQQVIKVAKASTPSPETGTIDNKYGVTLNTTKIISSGAAAGFQQVVGTVSRVKGDKDSELIEDFKLNGQYVPQFGDAVVAIDLPEIDAKGGQFSFYLPTNIPAQDIELAVTNATGGSEVPDADGAALVVTIEIRYNVTISPADLTFSFTGNQDPAVFTGKVTYSNDKPVVGAKVSLTDTDNFVDDVTTPKFKYAKDVVTSNTGEFGFLVLKWEGVGELALDVDTHVHLEGEVVGIPAAIKVTPNSGVVHTVAPTIFTVTGTGFDKQTAAVTLSLKKGSTPIMDDTAIRAALTTPAPTVDEEGALGEFKFSWEPKSAGTYTLIVEQPTHSAKATIVVVNPVSYNLINESKLTELEVDKVTLSFGSDIKLLQYKADGSISTDFVYTVYVDGKLAKDAAGEVLEKKLSGDAVVTSTKLGTRSIRVIAYAKDADGKYTAKVFDKTYTAKVTGWDVTMDQTTLTVNEAQDVTLVIKDENEAPVNNATITINKKGETKVLYSLNPTKYNAQNGTYVFKDVKLTAAGEYEVKVGLDKGGAAPVAKANLKLTVVGQKVYQVSSDVETLLQCKAQDVKLTITKDGQAVIPQRVVVNYSDGKTKAQTLTPNYLGNGVSKISVKALVAGDVVLRAENFDGTLCGEVTVQVVAPKLVLIDEETVNVTDNFKTKVNFKVVDPRDDKVITSNLAIEAAYTDLEVYDENDGRIVADVDGVVHVLGAEEHTLTILAKNSDFDGAEEDEDVVAVYLSVNGADLDGEFLVKAATIESDPGMIVIGANNNLTLTYTDANGKVIVGKVIKAGDVNLGKTDENGQVIYPVSVVTAAVKVTGATDVDKVVVEKSIKIGYDAEAPKATYDEESKTAKVTIVISDNVRLSRVQIDGKDVDFWPGAKYEYDVTLKSGVNKFHIKAQDTNYNVFDEVIEITLVEEGIKMVAGETTYVANGETKELAAAPYREGDYIMIAARVLEAFGAEFAWNGETKTATFKLDGKVVTVTANSLNATVDGETVLMPVAGKIVNDRMMVPIRFVTENLGFTLHWAAGDILTLVR